MGDFDSAGDGGAVEGVGGFFDPQVGPLGFFGGCRLQGILNEGFIGIRSGEIEIPGAVDLGPAAGARGGAAAAQVSPAEVIEDEGVLVDVEILAQGAAGIGFGRGRKET